MLLEIGRQPRLFGGSHSAITIHFGALDVYLLNIEFRSLRYQNDEDEAFEEAFDINGANGRRLNS